MSKSTTGMKNSTAHDIHEPGLLVQCPRCQYPLVGLPVEHHCPECGMAFDRRWQVFGGGNVRQASNRWARGLRVLIWTLAGIALINASSMAIVLIVECIRAGRLIPADARLLVVGVDGLILLLLVRAGKTRRTSFVVVTDEAVELHDHTGCVSRIARNTIRRARLSLGISGLVLDMKDGPPIPIRTRPIFGQNPMEIDACVAAINARSPLWRSRRNTPTRRRD